MKRYAMDREIPGRLVFVPFKFGRHVGAYEISMLSSNQRLPARRAEERLARRLQILAVSFEGGRGP